jgi:signal peptidase I
VNDAATGQVQKTGFWHVAASVVAVLLVIVFISALPFAVRTLLFQPFNSPSGSMEPTLRVGDFYFVSKYNYGYSRFSFPGSAFEFSGRLLGSEPQRGDVVVFRLPRDETTDYVKRIVGLPGDRIQMVDGLLFINGQPVKRQQLAPFADDDGGSVKRWRETLPNGVSYETLDQIDRGFLDNTDVYQVPSGHYFMMGDNRDNSTDSRVPAERVGGVGYIPFDHLIGRVQMVFFSIKPETRTEPSEIRFDRFGTIPR